jgi:hypothetical protein
MVGGQRNPLAIIVAALEARDPVPSFLDNVRGLETLDIADVADVQEAQGHSGINVEELD